MLSTAKCRYGTPHTNLGRILGADNQVAVRSGTKRSRCRICSTARLCAAAASARTTRAVPLPTRCAEMTTHPRPSTIATACGNRSCTVTTPICTRPPPLRPKVVTVWDGLEYRSGGTAQAPDRAVCDYLRVLDGRARYARTARSYAASARSCGQAMPQSQSRSSAVVLRPSAVLSSHWRRPVLALLRGR